MRKLAIIFSALIAASKAEFIQSPPVSVEVEAGWSQPPFYILALETAYKLYPQSFSRLISTVDVNLTPSDIYKNVKKSIPKSLRALYDLHISLGSTAPVIEASYSVAESEGITYDQDCPNLIHYQGQNICDLNELDRLDQLAWPGDHYVTDSSINHYLSDPTSEDPPSIIHYANPYEKNFREFYEFFMHRSKRINYILRWAPMSHINEGPQNLSGWGVKLDLKQREYLSDDDRIFLKENLITSDDSISNASDAQYEILPNDLKDALDNPMKLITSDAQLKDLCVNLISMLRKSSKPLNLLSTITQNYPLLAAHISELESDDVSDEIINEISFNQGRYLQPGQNAIWLNGRRLYDEDFDSFAILRHLEKETKLIDSIRELGFSRNEAIKILNHRALYAVQAARPDVVTDGLFDASDREEGGDSIVWINDLEHDQRYKSRYWTPLLRGLLHPLQRVARNYINGVLVIDLSNNQAIEMLSRNVRAFIDKGIPVRWGVTPYLNPLNRDSYYAGKLFYALIDKVGIDQTLDYFENISKTSGSFIVKAKSAYLSLSSTDEYTISEDNFDEIFKDNSINNKLEKVQAYSRRLGVAPGEHERSFAGEIFVNGRPVSFDEKTILNLQDHISTQTDLLTKLVYNAEIDEKSDISLYFYNLPTTLKRRNKYLQPSNTNENFINLPTEAFDGPFVVPETNSRIDVTLWLVADFDKPETMELITQAISGMIISPTFRLGFLHNPSELETPTGSISQTISKLSPRSIPLEFFEMLQNRGEIDSDDDGMEPAGDWIFETDFEPGEAGLILNGRVIGPFPPNGLNEDDYAYLFQIDYAQRVLPIIKSLEDFAPHRLQTDNEETGLLFTQLGSIIWKNIQNEQPQGIYEPPYTPRARVWDRLHTTKSSVRIGKETNAQYVFDIVLDPFSEQSQKWSEILKVLEENGETYIRISFNPNLNNNKLPINRFYRYNIASKPKFDSNGQLKTNKVQFRQMPLDSLFTLELDPPKSWITRPTYAPVDLDNLNLAATTQNDINVKFELDKLIIDGHARDSHTSLPPRGLQIALKDTLYDTQIVANLGYLQISALPGKWSLEIREGVGREIYELESVGNLGWNSPNVDEISNEFMVDSFEGIKLYPRFKKKSGMENRDVLAEPQQNQLSLLASKGIDTVKSMLGLKKKEHADINIFTIASGLLYERFASIMILSVLRHTDHSVKFWFIENFLSPSYIEFLPHFAKEYGFEYEFVTYKWPTWLRPQNEKQRMLWAYKILFLDVLFPMSLDKVIFVDADNIVRTDLKQLVDVDLHGKAYGYPPMGMDKKEMDGYRFWTKGYWKDYLRGRNYHISALYVVDLKRFRQMAAGDRLRGQYQALSADPNSLANLDQDLPNNFQTEVPIHTLDKSWLWCQTWNSDESLKDAKTIDLCNNPMTKEPKLQRAKRIDEWESYDEEIRLFSEKLLNENKMNNLIISKTEHLINKNLNNKHLKVEL